MTIDQIPGALSVNNVHVSSASVLCRSQELELLSTFLTDDFETTAPALIVQGYRSIGKTHTIETFMKTQLEPLGVNVTYVNCDECVTKRVLLQRCLKRIREDSGIDRSLYSDNVSYRGGEVTNFGGLCENFENFIIALEHFTDETGYLSDKPHVLVLDKIDQCMEIADDLYAAFHRLHEQSATVKWLSTVFVISSDIPKDIVTAGVPQIFFRAYTADEALEILQSQQLCFFDGSSRYSLETQHDFWLQYTKVIVDLYYTYSGSNMNVLIDICHELWENFRYPVESGVFKPTEFIKIYRANREMLLDDNVFNKSTVKLYRRSQPSIKSTDDTAQASGSFDLPIHSQFILMACYLASLIEPKYDLQLFSKLKTLRADAKKSKPSARANAAQQLTRKSIDTRLLTLGTFELERMLSILTVIYRNESASLNASVERLHMIEDQIENWNKELSTFTLNANIDINSQLATLASLGLVHRSSSDVLSAQARWKCNMSWSTAESIAKELNFPLKSYLED